MKIAIYSDNFYPEMSGISDSIIALAKELSRRGHRVNFYVPRYSKKNFRISKLKPEELNLGKNIEIFRLPSIALSLHADQAGTLCSARSFKLPAPQKIQSGCDLYAGFLFGRP